MGLASMSLCMRASLCCGSVVGMAPIGHTGSVGNELYVIIGNGTGVSRVARDDEVSEMHMPRFPTGIKVSVDTSGTNFRPHSLLPFNDYETTEPLKTQCISYLKGTKRLALFTPYPPSHSSNRPCNFPRSPESTHSRMPSR
jgi:hypothetical protein